MTFGPSGKKTAVQGSLAGRPLVSDGRLPEGERIEIVLPSSVSSRSAVGFPCGRIDGVKEHDPLWCVNCTLG